MLLDRCHSALRTLGADTAGAVAFFVPGRIEVLGKHTDYAGGRSLLAATEQGFCWLAAARSDNLIRIVNASSNEQVRFSFKPRLAPARGHWSNYPMTVARRIARNFPGPLRGADVAFASDLPPAAGLSSSSAMIVGMFLVLSHLNSLEQREEYRAHIHTSEELASYLGTIENGQSLGALVGDRGVGTFGGSEDHTAILCCKPGQISQYSFCPVRHERDIAMPNGCIFAIAASGVVAEKTGSALEAYNRLSSLVGEITREWNLATGRIDAHPAGILEGGFETDLRRLCPPAACDRLDQFIEESRDIIPCAAEALARHDLTQFGVLTARSQQRAEAKLRNQVPQTIHLARTATDLSAVAASAFGAGFGGSVWAMVARKRAEDFLARWRKAYVQAFPGQADASRFFFTSPARAAHRLA